ELDRGHERRGALIRRQPEAEGAFDDRDRPFSLAARAVFRYATPSRGHPKRLGTCEAERGDGTARIDDEFERGPTAADTLDEQRRFDPYAIRPHEDSQVIRPEQPQPGQEPGESRVHSMTSSQQGG